MTGFTPPKKNYDAGVASAAGAEPSVEGAGAGATGCAADLSSQHIDRVERGLANPSLTTIRRLADALEVSPRELLPE